MFWLIHLFNICLILSPNKFSLSQLSSCIITFLVIYHFSSIDKTCNWGHSKTNMLLEGLKGSIECQDVYSTLEGYSIYCPQKHLWCSSVWTALVSRAPGALFSKFSHTFKSDLWAIIRQSQDKIFKISVTIFCLFQKIASRNLTDEIVFSGY